MTSILNIVGNYFTGRVGPSDLDASQTPSPTKGTKPAMSHSETAALISACTGSFVVPRPAVIAHADSLAKRAVSTVSHHEIASLMAACTGSFVAPKPADLPPMRSSERDAAHSDDNKTKPAGFSTKLVSSSLGGATGAIVCYPFEGLKKRLQSGQITSILEGARSTSRARSALHPSELYRGVTAFAVSVTLATTSAMLFNKVIKESPYYRHDSSLYECGSAVMSGMLGAIVGSTPVENIILVQQLQKTNPIGAIKYMLQQGITRPWVGLRELMMREAGFAFVMLYGAGAAQKAVFEKTHDGTLAFIATLSMGLAGAACTQPFDVLATLRQRSNGTIPLHSAIKTLTAEKGMSGLFRGLSQRALLFTGCATIIPHAEATIGKALAEKMA